MYLVANSKSLNNLMIPYATFASNLDGIILSSSLEVYMFYLHWHVSQLPWLSQATVSTTTHFELEFEEASTLCPSL